MEVKGTIKEIFDTQVKGNNFEVRQMVLETDEQYPQDLLIQFVGDKTSVLDKYNIGDKVTIGINLRGRAWVNPEGETKYFNTIQGWRIDYTYKQNTEKQNTEPLDEAPEMTEPENIGDDEPDDLPF